MMAVSDGVVIGIVLGLVFAAVSYYLYSRQTQLERKVGLMENILLDLKVATEQTLLSSTEPTEHIVEQTHKQEDDDKQYYEFKSNQDLRETSTQHTDIESSNDNDTSREMFVDKIPRSRTPPSSIHVERDTTPASPVSVNYESMTYKELTQLAKQKGISGLRNLSKAQVIEAIRNFDNGGTSTTSTLESWKVSNTAEVEQGTSLENLASAQDTLATSVLASIEEVPETSLVSSD
jgi:hypothetical protein